MANIPLLNAHVHRWINRHPDEVNPHAGEGIPYDDYVSAIARITVIENPSGVQVLFRGHSEWRIKELIAQRLLGHLSGQHAGLQCRWSGADMLIIY